MAKKKAKKTFKKKSSKLSKDEKEELKAEGELPEKEVRESENHQLIWFFVIVIVIFASFLVPYFWIQSSKTFEFGGVDWNIDDEDEIITFYHTEFPALNGANINYNVYLRNDPRENDVYTEGDFRYFKVGGYLSWGEDIESCRGGQVLRAASDLTSFVRTGVGVGNIANAGLTPEFAEKLGFPFVNCLTTPNRTVILLEMGEPSVIQSGHNPYCYIVTIRDCESVKPIEKFIIKTLEDNSLRIKELQDLKS
ncbi:MAG: hypothetical protein KKF50_03705 [Nanoarchaeota archaeon]|nr:hypothetical protein [Nanoarchaeota archaeon]